MWFQTVPELRESIRKASAKLKVLEAIPEDKRTEAEWEAINDLELEIDDCRVAIQECDDHNY